MQMAGAVGIKSMSISEIKSMDVVEFYRMYSKLQIQVKSLPKK